MATTSMIAVAAEFEVKIREKVESGHYESTDAVIAEALRLLDLHEQNQVKLQELRELIAQGDEGEGELLTRESWEADLEEIRRSVRAKNARAPGEVHLDAPR